MLQWHNLLVTTAAHTLLDAMAQPTAAVPTHTSCVKCPTKLFAAGVVMKLVHVCKRDCQVKNGIGTCYRCALRITDRLHSNRGPA